MYEQKFLAAVEIVRAVKQIIEREKDLSGYRCKGEFDFATCVDLEVQRFIKAELAARFPEDQFMGEEGDLLCDYDAKRPTWILDPIDGTTNLIHHYPECAVSLGMMENGEIVLGVIYNPFLDQLFTAQRGCGAHLNGERIYVSKVQSLHESLISVGTAPYTRQHAAWDFQRIHQIFLKCQDIRRGGSAALAMAYVAAGYAEAYFERTLKPWDYAAAKVILEEAGGCMTTMEGTPVPVGEASPILASNGGVHGEMLDLLEGMPL